MVKLFFSKKKPDGFSLVELLVVIAVVGILIALVYVNFQEARKSARDKVRQTTLVDMQLALESYKAQTGRYPSAGCGADLQWATRDANGAGSLSSANFCTTNFIDGLVPSYIGALPNPNRLEGTGYYYKSDGNAYKLMVYNKVESASNNVLGYDSRFALCPSQCGGGGLCTNPPDPESYAVYSPGGECF